MIRARIRTMKPERAHDEKYGRMSRDARYLFDQLVSMADDEGRLRAMRSAIHGFAFPYDRDVSSRKLERWLEEIVASGMVLAYEHEGAPYLAFRHFKRHQYIERAQASNLPPPPDPGVVRENSVRRRGKGGDRSVINHGRVGDRSPPPAQARGPDPFPYPDPVPDPAVDVTESGARGSPHAAFLCRLLADLIRENDPKAKVAPESRRWLDAMRRLVDRDGRDPAEVERVIRWCQSDSFWRGNVLCPTKLREKFSQLTIKMNGSAAAVHPADAAVEKWKRRAEQWAAEDDAA